MKLKIPKYRKTKMRLQTRSQDITKASEQKYRNRTNVGDQLMWRRGMFDLF